jgi:hypothetical protein
MPTITWTNCQCKLSDLREWENNPAEIGKDAAARLVESLVEFGQIQPIAIDPDNVIIDGHQRKSVWSMASAFGPDYLADCRRASRALTERERQKLAVFLRSGAVGKYNWDALANWDAADLQEWGMDKTTLREWQSDAGALKAFIEANEPEVEGDEPEIMADRFEEVAEKWGTAEGQTWKAGEHLIYCGDSLDPENVKKLFGDNSPRLVIADPPYGVSIVAANVSVGGGESAKGMIPFGGKGGFRGTVGASKPFGSKAERGSDGAAHIVEAGKYPVIMGDETTKTAKRAAALYLGLYPSCLHVWWGGNYYTDAPLYPSPCWLIWNKETTGNFADCELAWTNQEKAARLFTHKWNGMLRDSERERRWHPTQKPAALAEWVYSLFTEEGQEIFDPFAGAGWTVLAAEKSGRKARVIEKSHEYVAVILERFSVAFPGIKIERIE